MFDLLFLLVIGFGLFVILAVILIYNGLVTLKNRVDNAWAQIDVQLKKRFDLVPNLVETVKGYAKHEKKVFAEVTKARTQWQNASSVGQKAQADKTFAGALKSIFAVAENYPDLKASENFKLLQEQLDGIESKIAYARQFYNDSVLQFNTRIQQIPYNMVAGLLGYKAAEYFETESAEKKPVKVKFE